MKHKPVVLIIRDGWGYSEKNKGNAIAQANTPNHDKYIKEYPTTLLKTCGNAVGLPAGVMGGSEVGHLTIGAGKLVWQPYELINRAIRDKSFFKNKELLKAIEHCKKNNSALHLTGLFSDAGVHSTINHLYKLLETAKQNKLEKVYVHAILDGRDVPERSALKFIQEFNEKAKKIGVGEIVSLNGRYYGMDRDQNWDRTVKAFNLMVHGKGFVSSSAESAILEAYERGDATDYYISPIILNRSKTVKDGDSLIFFNFRTDRARQLTAMFNQLRYCPMELDAPKIHFVCLTKYDEEFNLPVAFMQEKVENNLGKVISNAGLKQLRIAETEKYAHVTFFFNSQKEEPFENEERMLVPSPKVKSYDLQPEMCAYEVTEKLLLQIERYDFILLNFANPDLVGHSGVFEAVMQACAVVDECVGRIVDEVLKFDGVVLLTADHGNAEEMCYENNEPRPAHSLNPTQFTLISNDPRLKKNKLKSGGGLVDITATVLELLDLKKPKEMTSESLIL